MLLYRLLSTAALVAYSPYAIVRSWTGRRRLGDLRGKLARAPLPNLDGGVWLHAVSVGEVGVARILLRELVRRAPELRLGLSVTTAAGYDVASRSAEEADVFWFPIDLAGPVDRALSAVRPGLILLTETELWPLLLARAARQKIPVALVNGRISERSFRRARHVRPFFERVLSNISVFAMQSEADAERIRHLGAAPPRVRVTGNVKYDLPRVPVFADSARLAACAEGRPIFVAASTAQGEEETLLAAWAPLSTRSMLAIAPRRPERFSLVADLIRSRGFSLVRRTSPEPAPDRTSQIADRGSPVGEPAPHHTSQIADRRSPVYLLDSVGELASLYAHAALAFVGGSLVAVGGHNPIEAWAQGVPVVVGPHTQNVREVFEAGERAGFVERVEDLGGLERAFIRALEDPAEGAARGARARQWIESNRGAAAATIDLVLPLLEDLAAASRALP